MPDPIQELESLRLGGADVLPLPPSEIRRRGERLRRRRRATAVAGAAAAVAIIATTGALAPGALGGDRGAPPVTTPTPTDTANPDPTPSEPEPPATEAPEPEPESEIPDDFPLDAGLSGAKVSAVAGMASLDYCGTTPLAGLQPVDVRTAAMHGREIAITRTLYLLTSTADATAAHDAVMEAAWACSFADRSGGADGDVTIRKTVASWPGNTVTEDFAWGASTTEPAVEIVHVVSRGTALLVTSAYGSWSGGIDTGVAQTRAELRPVVEAMDVFDE